ncbi:CBS domain-containing protein [Streptomyces sp. ISL-22]|nr:MULTISPECIES: CBS domain-containing protein [unclassified Streptomyces]MBT2418520.1 CBS domain-containing protein [Streptomyces sp. ISL-24]MBT2434377.1 CBS domain-containing protein [Streptomyces sp. ISL-22]
MTPIPTPARQARPADGTGLTARDAMDAPGPQVDGHMTVDVALSVLLGARVPHLLLQDDDGRCTGLVTLAQLSAYRGGSWYGDRTRLRDIPLDRGPFTSSGAELGEAEAAMRGRALDVSPVIDEHGYALGVLALPY